jgi:hypothetical protein
MRADRDPSQQSISAVRDRSKESSQSIAATMRWLKIAEVRERGGEGRGRVAGVAVG